MTSNRPLEDWGKLRGDTAAVSALLDRLCITRTSSYSDRSALALTIIKATKRRLPIAKRHLLPSPDPLHKHSSASLNWYRFEAFLTGGFDGFPEDISPQRLPCDMSRIIP